LKFSAENADSPMRESTSQSWALMRRLYRGISVFSTNKTRRRGNIVVCTMRPESGSA